MATALAKAMKGETISDRQAKSALEEAVGRLTNMKKQAQAAKEELATAVETATGAVVHTVETQATLFGFSMVEGYRGGPDRMQLGRVDVRAPLGMAGLTYGLVGCFMKLPGSDHALAVGNGVVGSWLASLGAQAGLALAEKRSGTAAVTTPTAPTMQGTLAGSEAMMGMHGAVLGSPGAVMGAPIREVVLTPEPLMDEDDEAFGRMRGGRGGRGGGGRGGGRGRSSGRGGSQGGGGGRGRDGDQGRMIARQMSQSRGGRGGGRGGSAGRQGEMNSGGPMGSRGSMNRFRMGPRGGQSPEDEAA